MDKSIKNNNKIKVSFVDSPSSDDVTGSIIYIQTPNHNILVDCGMHQTNDRYEDFLVNSKKFKEFKAKNIDLIFITHAHIDHLGTLPRLYKEGCSGTTIICGNSIQVMADMLMDCAKINERDVQIINAQHNKNYLPLYGEDSVSITLSHTKSFPSGQKIVWDDELSFELIPSGHLLDSCQVKLYLTVGGVTKTILVTGDIGNKVVENHFVGEYVQVAHADYVIGESTYGDKPDIKTGKKERKNDLDKLKSIIDTQIHDIGGRVIIPTFAQSRLQSLALMVYQLYKDSEWKPKVYVDTPLGIKIFKDYVDCLTGEDKILIDELMRSGFLHFVQEAPESIALVSSHEPSLIFTTNGMCTVGRVRHYLKKCIPDPNSTILFVGYSTEGSLASLLKDPKRKTVTIDTKEYPCRCSVYSLKSMSGHAPFAQLVDDYSSINCQKLILHHGSALAKETLKKVMEQEYSKRCQTTRVIIANPSLKISL